MVRIGGNLMKILIEIPENFQEHFFENRFEDTLSKLKRNTKGYDQKFLIMLAEAIENAEIKLKMW